MNEIQAAMHRDRGLPAPTPFRFRNEDWNTSDFTAQPGGQEINNLYETRAPFLHATEVTPLGGPSTPARADTRSSNESLDPAAGPSTSRGPYSHCPNCICWIMNKMVNDSAESESAGSDEDPTITQDRVNSENMAPSSLRHFQTELDGYHPPAHTAPATNSELEEPDSDSAAAQDSAQARKSLKGKERAPF
ncbi:hypothetical protein EST38_g4 [Candolleomyces aberdarensis]|uniref:Uncharacterized protein n=1 Tax=Candolleomyces aberdarensis TaxID=2316362 RepID=A0A4V1Q5J0_9AGAR|nr:hypothetical protein EST38_g4 [Candolleomyces aberdarensis]